MFETAGLMKSSATRRGCQTVAGGRSEGQLVPRGDLRSGMSKGRHPEEGARMGATDYGFDVLCVWHPFRVASFLGPVPGVSRGTAGPRSTPGYSLASLQLGRRLDMLAETGILACRGLFRGNTCHPGLDFQISKWPGASDRRGVWCCRQLTLQPSFGYRD